MTMHTEEGWHKKGGQNEVPTTRRPAPPLGIGPKATESSLHAQIAAMEAYIAFLEGCVEGMGQVTNPLSSREVHGRVAERGEWYRNRINTLKESA